MNIKEPESTESWSKSEFGHAQLGNSARTKRLVSMSGQAANRPAGKVTEIFITGAAKEGAYKFIENEAIKETAVARAAHIACARRCAEYPFVFVPVDGSSLTIKDGDQAKGLGPIGDGKTKANGLGVMSAIAVLPDGTPVGICGQSYWARARMKVKLTEAERRKRPIIEKETYHWFETIQQTQMVFQETSDSCIPWYQLDRGGDFHEMLSWAEERKARITIRASQNRRIINEETQSIWKALATKPLLGSYQLNVIQGPHRQARVAHMEVRGCQVQLKLRHAWTSKIRLCTLHAVLVSEIGTVPTAEKPIEWLLLTNYEISNFDDACLVIFGYTQRWRIEEFHKTWKSTCGVEDSQLRDAGRIKLMAIILASVAMRIERLKYLARTKPDLPATVEFNRYEIDAVILQRKPKGYLRGSTPTIGLLVGWVADLGGYTGKSSGGPPGSIVIGRGLRYIQGAVDVLKTLGKN